MSNLTDSGKQKTDRLAMHLGLMNVLLQQGSPLCMVQQQALILRSVLKEIVDLDDEPNDAIVHIQQFLPSAVADLLAEDFTVPNDLEGLE